MKSNGSSIIPIQLPFTNTFVLFANCCDEHSNIKRNGVFMRIHFIMERPDVSFVIYVLIDKCLCKPILPPSGVSIGSINPH